MKEPPSIPISKHSVKYVRIVPMTPKQERKMYMKMKKKKIVSMLMECQKIIKQITP